MANGNRRLETARKGIKEKWACQPLWMIGGVDGMKGAGEAKQHIKEKCSWGGGGPSSVRWDRFTRTLGKVLAKVGRRKMGRGGWGDFNVFQKLLCLPRDNHWGAVAYLPNFIKSPGKEKKKKEEQKRTPTTHHPPPQTPHPPTPHHPPQKPPPHPATTDQITA